MEFELIETPENVELQQRLAGIGTRFLAGFVDLSAIACVMFLTWLALVLSNVLVPIIDILNTWLLAFVIVGVFLLIWTYFVLFELYTNGQTPGKKYMKVRVVKEGGGAVGFSEVAIRNLLRPVDGFPLYPVAGFSMFFTKRIQRLGDLAAGTVVISEAPHDYSASADRPKKTDWTSSPSAEDLRHTDLTPEEFRVLSSYQRRRDELTLDARERLLTQMLPPVLERLSRPPAGNSLEELEWTVDQLLAGPARPTPNSEEADN